MPGLSTHDELRFSHLTERLFAGDSTAETLVVRRFATQLVALARRELSARICQKTSPEDAVQSALGSFFKRLRRGQFNLATWDALWSLLVVMTIRKCAARRDYFYASRRDVRREIALAEEDGLAASFGIPQSREPRPEEALALAELIERLLQGLSDSERMIVVLRLEGYTIGEICQRQGRADRTVRRVLARARRRALHLTGIDDEESLRVVRRATGPGK
jgi:RNA polymerase sigma-70 factor (ECF subfamily)